MVGPEGSVEVSNQGYSPSMGEACHAITHSKGNKDTGRASAYSEAHSLSIPRLEMTEARSQE